jgi:hypothetical protein
MRKLRLSFKLIAVTASIVAATIIFAPFGSAYASDPMSKKAVMAQSTATSSKETSIPNDSGGHLYMQTNEMRDYSTPCSATRAITINK